jgi:hypothetical protein
MADFDFNSGVVVVDSVKDLGYTHDTVELTYTATMKQGSLVDASGVEVATADAADVVGAIDDQFVKNWAADELEVGDTFLASVAKRGCIFNDSALVYTDGGIDADGKTALGAAGMNKFTTVADDASII